MQIQDAILPVVAAAGTPVWLGAMLVGMVLAGLAGFAIGQWRARTTTHRAIERAKSSVANLYAHACRSVDEAQQACRWLEDYPNLQLSADQLRALDARQAAFLETMQRLVAGQLDVGNDPADVVAAPDVNWIREPESPVTKLPDRSALDANLTMLLELADESAVSSAVLLARMDKVDDLKARFGIAGVQQFQRKMGSLICRAMRDADIVCQYSADGFAVLMPGVDETETRTLCEAIRQTIRGHNFRLKDGPEVLVTASFGATTFGRGEDPEFVLNRAENALSKSRRHGRNQCHVNTGAELVACH